MKTPQTKAVKNPKTRTSGKSGPDKTQKTDTINPDPAMYP